MITLLGVGIFLAGLWLALTRDYALRILVGRWRPLPGEALAELAAELGLEIGEDGELSADGGQPLLLRLSARGALARAEARVPLRVPMPTGFLIEQRRAGQPQGAPLGIPGVDTRLQARTLGQRTPDDFSWLVGQRLSLDLRPPPDLAPILADPGLAAALHALLPTAREGSYATSSFVLLRDNTHDPELLAALLADARALAAALEAAADGWARAAAELGLAASPPDPSGARHIEGAVDGLPLYASAYLETTVQIGVPTAGLTIRAGSGGLALGNPVLDGAVRIHAADPESARARLATPEATGDVLAVILGFPGSSVEEGLVQVRSPGRADEATLRAMLHAGIALAQRLR